MKSRTRDRIYRAIPWTIVLLVVVNSYLNKQELATRGFWMARQNRITKRQDELSKALKLWAISLTETTKKATDDRFRYKDVQKWQKKFCERNNLIPVDWETFERVTYEQVPIFEWKEPEGID